MSENAEEQLEKIRQKCLNCQKCSLCNTRTNVVFAGGVPNHKLMLIGEAPGYYEDQKGVPFVGKAGQLLDKIFASVGLSREKDVYICNTIKCRPPQNEKSSAPFPRREGRGAGRGTYFSSFHWLLMNRPVTTGTSAEPIRDITMDRGAPSTPMLVTTPTIKEPTAQTHMTM